MKRRSGPKIRIGISSCLLGNAVRYDGGHKLDAFLTSTLGPHVAWVPVCPEVGCGLPVPREPMHLVGAATEPRLVTVDSRRDHTERLTGWARGELRGLGRLDLDGFVFKCRSPSCGLRDAKIFTSRGRTRGAGPGLFATAFTGRFPLVPAEDEERLHDPLKRSAFIERVFVYRRWRDFLLRDGTRAGLLRFHEDHRLQIMAHGPRSYARLEAVLRSGAGAGRPSVLDRYGILLMGAFRAEATTAKSAAALRHAASRLRSRLSNEERSGLRHAIELYRQGRLPIIVPLTLLLHHARSCGLASLVRQSLIHPDPRELILRFHA